MTQNKSGRLSSGERLIAALLRLSPWLAFLIIALPAPLYFFLRSFTATDEAGVYVLLAMTSLAAGSLVGLLVVLMLVLYRRRWEKKLRERLSVDGVTVDELRWFRSEMKASERRALKEMDGQNALLADAYRETLASRLTAARVIEKSRREILMVERRLREAPQLQGSDRSALGEDLQKDRARLEGTISEASEHQAEAETRLRMLEATASRGASETETAIALERLGLMREQAPLALEAARLEREARAQAEKVLRENNRRPPD